MNPKIDWIIIEPGLITLPTTGYEIRRLQDGKYQAYHNDKKLHFPYFSLDLAKRQVDAHMRDLIAVGLEP